MNNICGYEILKKSFIYDLPRHLKKTIKINPMMNSNVVDRRYQTLNNFKSSKISNTIV